MPETLNTLLEQDGPITQEQLTPDTIKRIREELSILTETERETKLRELLRKANSEAKNELQNFRNSITESTSSPEQHGDNFSRAELKRIAEPVIRDTPTTQGNANLFRLQKYFGQIHQPGINIDGISGPQTIGFMMTHILATQVFLRELGAKRADGVRVIPTDGIIDRDTQKAIEEFFGVDVEVSIATSLVETAQEEINTIKNLSDNALLKKLKEANAGLPETLADKRSYISELTRRFKEREYIISPNESNSFSILTESNNIVDMGLSQEDLGAIMLLMSMSSENIVAGILEKNIENNIFDLVINKFEIKKDNGKLWVAQDFISDDVRPESEIEKNKINCIGQIDETISKLKVSINEGSTTDAQKTKYRMWIQKLEIAKIFIEDQSIISDDSLQMAHDIAGSRTEMARFLGGTPAQQASIVGQMEAGDIKAFMIQQTPRLIISGIFAFFANLLPKGIKEIALAWIAGITGIGMYEDAQNRGLVPGGQDNLRGINSGDVTSPGSTERQDVIRNILTDAPNGLEARHETVYAKMVEKNTEGTYIEKREDLDTIFLFLSQDDIFGQKSKTELEALTSTTVWDVMSEYSKNELMALGITGEDLVNFTRMLKSEGLSDNSDKEIRDLFVVGQVTESANMLDNTWVQGESFKEQNTKINLLVSQISGVSYGADETLRNNSVRAKVEEALAKAQPSILAWMGQAVADRVDFVGDQVTKAENIAIVITALKTISATGDNEAYINGLIDIYEEIQKNLSLNENVHTYLSEASSVYTVSGRAYRGLENTVYWIQGLGSTIPTPSEVITPDRIDELIAQGESFTISDENLQKDVDTTIENLRLYKVKMLDDASRVNGLPSNERDALISLSDETLAAVIAANPTVYMETLKSLENKLSPLKGVRTNSSSYIELINGSSPELVSLQRLARINTGNADFDREADRIYREAFTDGIAKNFRSHLESKANEVSRFNTNATTLEQIRQKQELFNTLRGELLLKNWETDILTYFNIGENITVTIEGVDYFNIITGANAILLGIDSTYSPLIFDINTLTTKQRELSDTLLALGGSFTVNFISPNVDSSSYSTNIDSMIQEIGELPENVQEGKMNDLKFIISATIDEFTQVLENYSVNDITKIEQLGRNYEILIDTDVGNAGNEDFENALERKKAEITEYELKEKLKNTTLDQAGNKAQAMIDFIMKYRDYENIQNEIKLIFGSVNIDTATASVYDFMTLVDIVSSLASLGDDVTTTTVEQVPLPDGYKEEGQSAINLTIEHIKGNTLLELSSLAKEYIASGINTFNLLFR